MTTLAKWMCVWMDIIKAQINKKFTNGQFVECAKTIKINRSYKDFDNGYDSQSCKKTSNTMTTNSFDKCPSETTFSIVSKTEMSTAWILMHTKLARILIENFSEFDVIYEF